MAKAHHLAQNSPLPEWFLDELQEFLSTYVSPNLAVSINNPTTLQVLSGTGNGQTCIAIGNPADVTVYGWRWNSATVTAAAPGTLIVGDNDVYVTGSVNGPYIANGTPPPAELDTGTLSYGLAVLPPGTSPSGTGAQAYYRKVASATWSGAAFTDVRMLVGPGSGEPQKHAASHLTAGSDPIDWHGTVHARGTLAARPAYSAAVAGYLYFATDVNGGTLYRASVTLAAWDAVASGLTSAPNAHAASHLAGGSDAIAWGTAHGSGTLAARPAAGSSNSGYLYVATDVNGGTLYRSDGAAWSKVALGATETPSNTGIAAALLTSGTLAARPAAAGGNAAFYYWASDVNGGTLYQSTGSAWTQITAGITQAPTIANASLSLAKLAHLLLQGPDDSTQVRFAYGHSQGTTVGPSPATYGPISFGFSFGTTPIIYIWGAGSSPNSNVAPSASNFSLVNMGNGGDGINFNWIAIGAA